MTANVLVVGGGVAGGTNGGGGGCGYQSNTSFTVTPQAYSVTVGAGGSGIVIVSVARADFLGSTIIGGTKTIDGANDIYIYFYK